MLTKPSVAINKVTIRDEAGQIQLISTTPRELVSLLASAGGASCAFRIYDTNDVAKLDVSNSIFIAANAGESTPFCPSQLVQFKVGIVIVIEQGFNNNAELFMLLN